MELKPLGNTGVMIPEIGLGVWRYSGGVEPLRRGIELGAFLIDTAEMYGAGRVERLVGEAIAGRRSEAFLVSKVLPQNASREGTVEACERSLGREPSE